jgi:ATP-dependent DNA helicase RecG
MENLAILIAALCKLSDETPYVEFKHNNFTLDMIGQDISALANSAALHEKRCAYMLWGIDDKTHEIVGTKHNLQSLKKGQQELENWLRSMLSKNADFEYHSVLLQGKTVGVLIIPQAVNQTVSFQKFDYIRIGSYTKKLNEYPRLQAKLWDKLRNQKFEERYAKQDFPLAQAIQALNCTAYFDMLGLTQPTDNAGIAHYLQTEEILVEQDNGLFAITNLGAILFAKKLTDFPRLSRKAMRIVQYSGNNRLDMRRENIILQGYATGFEALIQYAEAMLPAQEIIEGAARKTKTVYPLLAIRESIANALIHQDFAITGTGPLIEIFPNRIEITNPGTILVDINRIIDTPPKSRNEKLAALMRRLKLCEELGTGWDKIVLTCEAYMLPAPKINLYEESTKVTLFAKLSFKDIASEDRLRACYLHACIKQVQGEHLTNRSLRGRFGLKESASGTISRLIKDAIDAQLIKPLDPTTAPRYMKYLPIWA